MNAGASSKVSYFNRLRRGSPTATKAKRRGVIVVLLGHPEQRLPNTLAVGFRGKIGSGIRPPVPTFPRAQGLHVIPTSVSVPPYSTRKKENGAGVSTISTLRRLDVGLSQPYPFSIV